MAVVAVAVAAVVAVMVQQVAEKVATRQLPPRQVRLTVVVVVVVQVFLETPTEQRVGRVMPLYAGTRRFHQKRS